MADLQCAVGVAGDSSSTIAVLTISGFIAFAAILSWRSAKKESWSLVAFLCSMILGFNTNHVAAAWMIESMAGIFFDIAGMISEAIGTITIILLLLFLTYIFHKLNFDMLRVIAIGTLLGIVLRMAVDGLFYLLSLSGWVVC